MFNKSIYALIGLLLVYIIYILFFHKIDFPEPSVYRKLTVQEAVENEFYLTEEDTVRKILTKIIEETEIIWPRPLSSYLHRDKTILNPNNWDCIGLHSYYDDYYQVKIYVMPKSRLWFLKKTPILLDYYDRWLWLEYVEDSVNIHFLTKIDSIRSFSNE